MGLPPEPAKRSWKKELAAFLAGFKKHLLGFTLEFGRVLLKTAGLG